MNHTSFPLIVAHTVVFSVTIWTGVSRRWWFVRALAMVALLIAMFAVRAYQPLVWCSLAMPMVVWCSRMTIAKSSIWFYNDQPAPASFRFRIVDVLLAMLLLGVFFAMLAAISRAHVYWEWQQGAWAILCVVLSLLCSISVSVRGWRRWFSITALIGCLGAIFVFGEGVFADSTIHWFSSISIPGISSTFTIPFFIGFTTLLFATLHLFRLAFHAEPQTVFARQLALLSRVALAIGGVVLLIPALAIYVAMLKGPPTPPDSYVTDASSLVWLEKLMAACDANPNQLTLDELRRRDPREAAAVKQVYDQLIAAVESPQHMPEGENHLFDVNGRDRWDVAYEARGLALRLDAEIQNAAQGNDFDRAATYGLATVQIGNNLSRGGIRIDSLVGLAVEGIGTSSLIDRIADTSPDTARSLLDSLVEIDASRELAATTNARDLAYTDRTYGWTERLDAAYWRLIGDDSYFTHLGFVSAIDRRNTMLRLLIYELAIRLYEDDSGEPPMTLEALVPEYLAAVPIDAYSGKPLLFHRTDTGIVAYSVGPNEVDNGGNFGGPDDVLFGEGDYDLDLRTFKR